jgi:hypothetical protein
VRRSLPALAVAVGLAGAAALGACGQRSPDLLVVQRTGTVPGARLTLLVNDGGTVRCNGGGERRLSDPQLLQARTIVRELDEDARRDRRLAAGPGSVLRYRLRMEAGTVEFSDTSPGARGGAFAQTQLFTRRVAQGVCRLAR